MVTIMVYDFMQLHIFLWTCLVYGMEIILKNKEIIEIEYQNGA